MVVTVITGNDTKYIFQESQDFPAGMTQVKMVRADGTEKKYCLHKPVFPESGKCMTLHISDPEKWDLNETIRISKKITFPVKGITIN